MKTRPISLLLCMAMVMNMALPALAAAEPIPQPAPEAATAGDEMPEDVLPGEEDAEPEEPAPEITGPENGDAAAGISNDDAEAKDCAEKTQAFSVSAQGSCGANVTWKLSGSGLMISGTGDMYDYATAEEAPWFDLASEIVQVFFDDGVTSIGNWAFAFLDQVRWGSRVPDTVTRIGDSAFQGCSYDSITIPLSVKYVGTKAYLDCNNAKYVDIRGADVDIGPYAFGYKTTENGLVKRNDFVVRGRTGSTAQKYAEENGLRFESNDILGSGYCGDDLTWVLDVDDTLTISGTGPMYDYKASIGSEAPWHEYFNEIKKLIIEDGVTTIGDYAFNAFTKIPEIILPDGITSIGAGGFRGCSSATEIRLPESVTSIGEQSFYACSSAREIKLPAGLTSIPTSAFQSCYSLTRMEIPEGVTNIGKEAFDFCYGLQEVKLPQSLTFIQADAFSFCTKLANVEIPAGVISIGPEAFMDCIAITEITIPQYVQEIGDSAFERCYELTRIVIEPTDVTIGQRAFGYFGGSSMVDGAVIVGYPGSTAQTYAEANGIRFKSILEPEVPPLPEGINITGDVLNSDKANTTSASYKELLGGQGDVQITDKTGAPLAGEALVGTGCQVTLDGRTLTVMIPCEVDGDGKIGLPDVIETRKAILLITRLEGVYLQAAQASGSTGDRPSVSDAITIRKTILGIG